MFFFRMSRPARQRFVCVLGMLVLIAYLVVSVSNGPTESNYSQFDLLSGRYAQVR